MFSENEINNINNINNIEEEKFRIMLEHNLDSILLKKYNLTPSTDFISKTEVKNLIDKAIENIKNIYLNNRKPNTNYELGDIAYLPYSSKYYLECVTIDNRVNNGKTSSDELLGVPKYFNDNDEEIDPIGQLIEDGGILWKIYAKYDGFDNNQDISIETKLIEATDVILKGSTRIQDGTLIQDYNNSNPKATEDILQLADVQPALKYKNNTEVYEDEDVVARGIAVGRDATISAVTTDNHIGIRGNSDYEKNDPSKGGILFGNWGITGIAGDANDLIVYTARNGAIVARNTPILNGDANINLTDLGKATVPFNTLYVKNIQTDHIAAKSSDFSSTNSIGNIKAIENSDSVIPLIAYNSGKAVKLNYTSSVTLNTMDNTITASGFIGNATSADKVKVTKANNATAYLLGVKSSESGKISPIYDSGVYLTAQSGELVATKFIGNMSGVADKAKSDENGNSLLTYIKNINLAGDNLDLIGGNGRVIKSISIGQLHSRIISTRTRSSSETVY